MAIVCRDLKLLFIMVPGTGCSVVGQLLLKEFGGSWLPERNLVKNGKLLQGKKHNNVQQLLRHGIIDRETLEDYLVVATVRNPFDRFVTYYQRLVGEWTEEYFEWIERDLERSRPNLSEQEYAVLRAARDREIRRKRKRMGLIRQVGFNTWMKGALLRAYARSRRPQHPDLLEFTYPMLQGVDVVMRYGQLEDALNEVLREVGVRDAVTLPRKNVTQGKEAYEKYYAWTTRKMTELVLKRELALFGHAYGRPDEGAALVRLDERRRPAAMAV